MALGMNLKRNSNVDYPGMKVKSIRIFSALCIVCGIASICMQTVTLAIYLNIFERHYVYFPSDIAGHGIWGGAFYLTVGALGMAVINKRKKSLLVAAVVMSAISIFVSFLAAFLSAAAVASFQDFYCKTDMGHTYSTCDTWLQLQSALVGCNILAFISSMALVILVSESLCTCCRKHNSVADTAETYQETYVGQRTPHHQLQYTNFSQR